MRSRRHKKPQFTLTPQVIRRLKISAAIAAMAGIFVTLALWMKPMLMDPANLPVNAIAIEGNFAHVSAQQVRELVRPYVSEGLMGIDVEQIKQAIQEMPWVESASVRRVWPDTLHVTLIEHVVIARWGENGLISVKGTVFYPGKADLSPYLPALQGPQHSEQSLLASYHEMNRILSPLLLEITRFDLDQRRSLQLSLSNGITVHLGRKDDIARLQRMVKYYPRIAAEQPEAIQEIDLRYPNGFAVKWDSRAGDPGKASIG